MVIISYDLCSIHSSFPSDLWRGFQPKRRPALTGLSLLAGLIGQQLVDQLPQRRNLRRGKLKNTNILIANNDHMTVTLAVFFINSPVLTIPQTTTAAHLPRSP
jgi:hypothetical protein